MDTQVWIIFGIFMALMGPASAESYYNSKNQQQNSLYCNDLNPQHGVDIDSVSFPRLN